MPLLGDFLNKSVKLTKLLRISRFTPYEQQKRELKKLLTIASNTQLGVAYDFKVIVNALKLTHEKGFYYKIFKENVPVFTYNKIFNEWWHKTLEGEADVAWPGIIKYYALSSGTSEATSKYIPITKEQLKAIRKTGARQLLALRNFDIPADLLTKGVLMLGGSTSLEKTKHYLAGDLSGITTGKLPRWFQYFYKPGKKIAKTKDWNVKLDLISKKAKDWDMGYVAGVPAWMQLLFEKIIKENNVKNIHEVWPNLAVFAHGGVAFEPYKKGFERLLGKPITYIETYLASEGFLAYQHKPDSNMRLVLDNGIFFEFVPFTEKNFNEDGDMVTHPETLLIDAVEDHKDYAILISTVAGAWRYLIGDTIKFTNKKLAEIVITGRTKHYISVCGEHLSVENMNRAISNACSDMNISIKEFTVAGVPYQNMFAHKWFIGSDDKINTVKLKVKIDEYLKELNDDYRTERISALKDVFVNVLPTQVFLDWMKSQGKEGGQNKFPRVLKKEKLADWEAYIKSRSFITSPTES